MWAKERVLLFWTRMQRTCLRTLSTNVLREICSYLDADAELPFYADGQFGLFIVASKKKLLYECQESFQPGTTLCYVGNKRVMCLGRTPTTFILSPQSMLNTAPMAHTRYCPGTIHYRDIVYAFGGSIAPRCTAEKYSLMDDTWTNLPDMRGSRYAFNPIRIDMSIYLPEVNESSHMVEVFHIGTETYTTLSSSLPFAGYSSISYVYKDEIVIIDFQGRRARGQIQPDATFNKDDVEVGKVECYSQAAPVVLGRKVYFAQYKTGIITSFSLDTSSFEVPR